MPIWGFNKLRKLAKSVEKSTLKNVTRTTKDSVLNVILQGKITANVLNIRSTPSLEGEKLGRFTKNDIFSVIEKTNNGWYRFKYNNRDAYVYGKYVAALKGKITANVLNVRQGPTLNDKVLGKVSKNDIVTIAQALDKWFKVKYKTGYAYIYSQYVEIIKEEAPAPGGSKMLKDDPSLLHVQTEASRKLHVPSSPRTKRVSAETYNNFGGLLDKISSKLGIDPAAAVAVLAVESGGKAYGPEGKVLIRFENHLFYRFWGKQNRAVFDKHFQFSRKQYWTNHLFRKSKRDEWISFHGNQKKEWEVFEFAKNLNSKAAHISASYGAPQILGTNYKTVGYNSPNDLLDNFSKDVRFHVMALFDFFNPQMIRHIKNKDFTSFARYYNGAGQASRYGKYIKDYYNAFKSLT